MLVLTFLITNSLNGQNIESKTQELINIKLVNSEQAKEITESLSQVEEPLKN